MEIKKASMTVDKDFAVGERSNRSTAFPITTQGACWRWTMPHRFSTIRIAPSGD